MMKLNSRDNSKTLPFIQYPQCGMPLLNSKPKWNILFQYYQIFDHNRKNVRSFLEKKQKKAEKKYVQLQNNQQEIAINLLIIENGFENEFTRYVPISRHIATEEMAKRNFPVLADHTDSYTKFSDLLLTQKWTEQNKLLEWGTIKQRFILFADLGWILIYSYQRISSRDQNDWSHVRLLQIPHCLNQGAISTQMQRLFNPLFHTESESIQGLVQCQNHPVRTIFIIEIQRNMPFSIFEHEEINENSLQINDKIFFCSKCVIYHCFRHDPLTIQVDLFDRYLLLSQEANYQSPYVNQEIYLRTASRIIQFYNFLLYGLEDSLIPKLRMNQCSEKCYKDLTNEIYTNIKSKKIPIGDQFIQSLIAIVILFIDSAHFQGIETLGYDICSIAQRLAKKYTCQLLFVYLIEQLDLQKKYVDRYVYEGNFNKKRILKPKPVHLSHQIYIPCKHYFNDQKKLAYQEDCSDCKCGQNWKFCDKYCLCNPQLCKIKRAGCSCLTSCKDEECICWSNGAECDPDLCSSCFRSNERGLSMRARKEDNIHCRNNEIFFKITVKTVIGNSKIYQSQKEQGYGLFLVEPVDKNDMIIQYIGEVINDPEQEVRAILDKQDPFFAFEIVDKEKLIDAKYFGNKARFINHSKLKNNCEVKNIYSQGNIYIGIYALNELMPGTEILIDYDGNNELAEKHPWINKGLTEEEIRKLKKVKQIDQS